MAPFTIKLEVLQRSRYLSARCADVPGLHITGASLEDLRRRAIPATKRLLKTNRGIDADVFPTDQLTELRVRPHSARLRRGQSAVLDHFGVATVIGQPLLQQLAAAFLLNVGQIHAREVSVS